MTLIFASVLSFLPLSPHHSVDDVRIALNDLHHFRGHIFVQIVRHGHTQVSVGVHGHCGVHRLQDFLFRDARQDEVSLVHGLRPFGGSADADGREGMSLGKEEAALLRKGAAVGDDGEGVHLQAVVVVKAQGLVADHPAVQFKAAFLQALSAPGMAGVQDGHVIFLRHAVDCSKEGKKVFFRVDVFLPVGGEKDVASLFQTQAGVDVAGFDFRVILLQDFGHGGTRDVGALFRQPVFRQIAPGVFGVAEVDVADDVHDSAVGLLRQAFVLAAVSGFHVKDRDVEPLGGDGGQAGVGVSQNQQRFRPELLHEAVGAADDVSDGLAQVFTHGIQIDFRLLQLQVPEEDAVEAVVVVLSRMRQNAVEIFPALFDHLGQADDLRPGADDDQELQAAVLLE